MVQALADSIALVRKQYKLEFPQESEADLLPLQDAIAIQKRFRDGSVGTLNFDLLWYLQHGAHLISGSSFMKRHRTTVFKPFGIQEKMVEAIYCPGPQCVFGIAPPGTGKTAVVCHLLSLFPGHSLVFCCAALPVVLGVGRISNTLGLPFAFVKGRRITPSYSCGRGLGHVTDGMFDDIGGKIDAIGLLRYRVMRENLQRKKKRLATKKKSRSQFDLKKMPKIYLMCDVASCAWLLRQLDPNRTLLVIDEPPMGSDVSPANPSAAPLSCAMIQSMLTSTYKTIWMSATLPRVEALPTLVNNFMERYKIAPAEKDAHVKECFSTELDRGALMCGPSGAVAFPHQKVKSADELQRLCRRLPGDPLVLKSYTERALATLLERWSTLKKEGKVPDGFSNGIDPPDEKFADLSDLNHASIRGYAMELLAHVAAQGNDQLAIDFCEARPGAEKNFFPKFDLDEILFRNAFAYPGLTLVASDDPKGELLRMAARLMEHMPTAASLDDDLKAQEAKAAAQDKYKDDDEEQTESGKHIALKFNPELVIQSEQFLKKWCKIPDGTHVEMRFAPSVGEFKAIKELPVDERWQMLGLAGAGAFDPTLNSDPGNPVYTQWVHEQMTLKKLACVTAGKEFTWGANVPASTVVVTKAFAETTSVAGMLQYVGRAARRGLTTHGQAVFEREEDLDRIFSSPDGLSTEAITMERYAKWWLSKGAVW